MEMVKKWIMEGRVGMGMVVVQGITTGLQLLARVILSEGTFVFALMAYRHVVAAFALLLSLFTLNGAVKKLSIAAFFWLFMVALTGISMTLGLFYYGLKDTTATYATNFLNLIPLITFLFSTILRNPRAWRLAWNLQLLTIFYSGIFATAATFCLISWAITQKGPTYPSMFNPLSLILIAIAEAVFLGEDISLGSLIGMGLIIAGLYSFLWGKSKDTKPTLLPIKESGAGGGGGDAAPESAGLPSSATIVPAASPN
ncbi:UNVERIFIED_CONTAM: WAT1-related protein [Sesamum calycinum]|uniref:WAT1-related protein n=1 Tax=Sesamum calycinum TaxID=2727403 RepID=A0AAW2LSZ9_9LAMI